MTALEVQAALAKEKRAFIESVELAVPLSCLFDTDLHLMLSPETMAKLNEKAARYADEAWAVIEADVLSQVAVTT